jgi:hypothetical protein
MRKNKTGYSTDHDVLDSLREAHPIIGPILEHRELIKLKNTYIDALPPLVNPKTGRLHTSFRQAVAATGRLSSTDPNLQNIPIRTELGREIRRAFVAPPGKLLVSADYSQIELRVLAHLSHDPTLLRAFQEGVDVHGQTAAEVFGIPLAEVGPSERRASRTSAWPAPSTSRRARRATTSSATSSGSRRCAPSWTTWSPRPGGPAPRPPCSGAAGRSPGCRPRISGCGARPSGSRRTPRCRAAGPTS